MAGTVDITDRFVEEMKRVAPAGVSIVQVDYPAGPGWEVKTRIARHRTDEEETVSQNSMDALVTEMVAELVPTKCQTIYIREVSYTLVYNIDAEDSGWYRSFKYRYAYV